MAPLERISKRRRGPDERRHHCACSGNAPPLPPFFFRRSRPIAPGACHGGGWAPRKSEGEYRPARDYTRLRPTPWRRSRDPGPLSIREKIGRGRGGQRSGRLPRSSDRGEKAGASGRLERRGKAKPGPHRPGVRRGPRNGPPWAVGRLVCFFFAFLFGFDRSIHTSICILRVLGPLLAGATEPFMARASLTYL